jgi:hypothetical protein
LDDIAEYPNPVVREFVAAEKARLAETIEADREEEVLT